MTHDQRHPFSTKSSDDIEISRRDSFCLTLLYLSHASDDILPLLMHDVKFQLD